MNPHHFILTSSKTILIPAVMKNEKKKRVQVVKRCENFEIIFESEHLPLKTCCLTQINT